MSPSWPHAPPHDSVERGAYIVTCGTYRKLHHFQSRKRLRFLCDGLVESAGKFGWKMQAWAVFSNHYHFVAHSPNEGAENLSEWLAEIHRESATFVNELDEARGRQNGTIFFQTPLTYQKSYLARLNYVQRNAVKHGLVEEPKDYPWCSAGWFEKSAPQPFQQIVSSFKTGRVNVYDDF